MRTIIGTFLADIKMAVGELVLARDDSVYVMTGLIFSADGSPPLPCMAARASPDLVVQGCL